MNDNEWGALYLVPTPIGNLEDMTYRSVRILGEVDAIAAEDTRHTGILLKHFDIKKPLISYHEHNKEEKGAYILELLLEGQSIACVSDAGMPAISDPGADLVTKAIEEGIAVVPLPGANAALTALIASGLDTKSFTFAGFLPKRGKHRIEELKRLSQVTGTLLFYEAPHRLQEVLQDMYEVFGNRSITVARELTKKFETFVRTDLESL
ncbi:MAG: 16S rRNA (cytidine(1402)-2'-O)-methyltransferase, partial [Veillonella sp.]|nr:16S rRNA (cytidine(1402)-2'-O)-methyltransferase [Veillonella sp.]